MNDLRNAGHIRCRELAPEHLADGDPARNRLLNDLMVYGVLMVQFGQPVSVAGVEPAHPFFYDLARRHRLRPRIMVVCRLRLDQIPAVAIEILENRHDAVGLMPWRFNEPHAGGGHARMIALEIIRC